MLPGLMELDTTLGWTNDGESQKSVYLLIGTMLVNIF